MKGPKNVVFLICDGCGVEHFSVILEAIKGIFTASVLVNTKPVQAPVSIIADSASGATAFASGYTVKRKKISPKERKKTCFEIAHKNGKKTAILTNCEIDDATPASFYAHCKSRYNKQQIRDWLKKRKPDVLSGCVTSERQLRDIKDIYPKVISGRYPTPQEFKEEVPICILDNDEKSIPDAMQRVVDMSALTRRTIYSFKKSKKPYFVVVEEGQADIESHQMNSVNLRQELHKIQETILAIAEEITLKDTLFIVTTDHSTGGLFLTNKGEMVLPYSGHTSHLVPLFAVGAGSEAFCNGGIVTQAEIGKRLISLMSK